jgi:hypothetical protein
MLKILIAAAVSAFVLGGAGANLAGPAPSLPDAEARSPAVAVCVAGLEMALGGERPLSLSMSHNGRCGCPAACSAMTFTLAIAGLTLRL